MSSINHNSIVNSVEAEALKEMIFKRARERAASLDNEVKNSYTSSMQNDIMDLARESFTSSKNPFTKQITEEKPQPEPQKEIEEIGFPQRKIEEFKSQIVYKNKTTNEEIIKNTVNSNMSEARANFAKKESFMGALNFLNSQAAMSLIYSKGQNFEALA